MNATMQQTVFSVEKIKNVVNVGRSSAYQIYTTPGEQIGYLGKLGWAELDSPANDSRFIQASPSARARKTPASWLKKSLTGLSF
ncbi:MAG: hypothetical protein OES53_11625 [Xanthomonadales bacterium]|jgi:hypothetical protein|nr:hypothetical protein [Xanthomonadales bacterium]MDH3924157.1 hypothetical protein [Xanthomonadales bacterium]MDH3940297.1 hypothetical protein [Xanthomonadales bacterium]MDH4002789.1 hypothetical protein [Xanthomonadales bacterium]